MIARAIASTARLRPPQDNLPGLLALGIED